MAQEFSIAVDIGGTFTDVVLCSDQAIYIEKTLTTPEDLLKGFFTGLNSALRKAGIPAKSVTGVIVHATTVVTNALIERKGARTGMIFTAGFGDILRIRDERRYDVYDPQIEFPEPLLASADVFTLKERVLADGSIESGVDESEVDALARDLTEREIASVGICFLHSYRNNQNEQAAARALLRRLPGLNLSLSSDVAPQIREYLRASTTAANAYAVPITQPYLHRLESRLAEEGFSSKPLIMLSSGGVVGPATAGRLPVRMIESGPAAGALGASFVAQALKLQNLLAFDMGGTTAKVCLIQDYRPLVTGSFEIDRMYRFKEGSGLPITVPCIDMIEIGSGGGSIAQVNELGLLKVGPRSAGSRPGPACYGGGGSDATVTDADVVLGAIDAGKFLGGTMRLDSDAAHTAIAPLAQKLGVSTIGAARGIYEVVCESMASAVRAHAADRGIDYRGAPLLAFGGAGPVHACGVARLLKSSTVIFPPLASVFSAFGSLVTPIRLDLVRTNLARIDGIDWSEVDGLFDQMEHEGWRALIEAGCAEHSVSFTFAADMRYFGQQHEITVELGERPSAAGGTELLRRRFESDYDRRYRITQPDIAIEVTTWRIIARGPAVSSPRLDTGSAASLPEQSRRVVHIWEDGQDVLVMPRQALVAGEVIQGPAILEEDVTTLVIPPGWTASLGELGCVVAVNQK